MIGSLPLVIPHILRVAVLTCLGTLAATSTSAHDAATTTKVRHDEQSVTSITLYPNASIEIDRVGRCDRVTNITSQSLVFLPITEAAWAAFAKSNYPFVSITTCRAR